MRRLTSWLRFGGTVVVSLLVGVGLHAGLTWSTHSGEPCPHKLERQVQEAAGSFYDAMRELFAGTHSPQEGRVSASALAAFNKYRPRLEPKCWLVNVWPHYGIFYGDALFPSGDIFEVGMRKTDKGWVLEHVNHMGTRYFFHDLAGPPGQ